MFFDEDLVPIDVTQRGDGGVLKFVKRPGETRHPLPAAGDTVVVHYTERVAYGPVFISTYERGTAIQYCLGGAVTDPGIKDAIHVTQETCISLKMLSFQLGANDACSDILCVFRQGFRRLGGRRRFDARRRPGGYLRPIGLRIQRNLISSVHSSKR